MKIATAEQMREMDRIAIKERGVPSTELMERAARALTRAVLEQAGQVRDEGERPYRVVCFCGAGNNGGDGVATARMLLERGCEVRAVLVGKREKMTADCREMERRLGEVGGILEEFEPDSAEFAAWCLEADVMVDALFGIGLNTEIRGGALLAVHMMNTCDIPVVSADIASGVEADTGRILGQGVQAGVTVTFSMPKAGHFLGEGAIHTGRLEVAYIGIPMDLMVGVESQLNAVTGRDVVLPRRSRTAHKGDFGKVYLLAGSVGYTGAPVLAAKAAMRTGSGLVTVGVPAPAWPVVAGKLDEAMAHPLPAGKDGDLSLEATELAQSRAEKSDVCLIGPGLGRGNSAAAVVRTLLRAIHTPVILDADGINALAGHIDVLDERKGLITILTPHDGEFARISDEDISGEHRLEAVRSFARTHGCCLVLKGYRTITAFPDGTAYINTNGNPGMAVGGSGDVLSGVILSLIGQGIPCREAVPMAVWLHGAAGDLCARELGEYGMLPSDMIARLPEVLERQVLRR